MTTQQAIGVVTEIIRENRENGELEGVLNRHRIAALNHLVRLGEAAIIKAIALHPTSTHSGQTRRQAISFVHAAKSDTN